MNNRRIITTEESEEDIRIEGTLRPQHLSEYIGQERAKSCLLYTSPFNVREDWVKELQGLSLKNVSILILSLIHI